MTVTFNLLTILIIVAGALGLFDGIVRLRGRRGGGTVIAVAEIAFSVLLILSLFVAFPAPFGLLTWAILLVAMFFKWVLGFEEAVRIPGMIHGVAAFIPFVIISLLTARSLKWSLVTTFWALVSSVPPFGSVIFERWAVNNGKLGELSAPATGATTGAQDRDGGRYDERCRITAGHRAEIR